MKGFEKDERSQDVHVEIVVKVGRSELEQRLDTTGNTLTILSVVYLS